MVLLIIYAVLAIFFSFLCSILEAVLLSVTPTFVKVKQQEGKAFANQLQKLKDDVDKPLIAILTINTIAHTVGAILVGVQASKVFNASAGESIVAGVMTLLILVVSEIIPKTIGATYWQKLAGFTATSLKWMILPLKWTGIMWILQRLTKLFGSGHHGSVFSRADYTALTHEAADSGALEQAESKIIKNLLRFDQIQVNDIMTPRTVMVTANEDTHFQNFYKSNKNLRFSRVPVFNTNPDDITGYALKDDILQAIVEGNGEESLKTAKRNILLVKTVTQLPELFELLTEKREHIAIVEDDYGSVVGLVTMEDVVETLLGLEIMDELDNVADLQKLARGKWEERAKLRGIINQ